MLSLIQTLCLLHLLYQWGPYQGLRVKHRGMELAHRLNETWKSDSAGATLEIFIISANTSLRDQTTTDILQMSLEQVRISSILPATFKPTDFIPQSFVWSIEVHASHQQMLQKIVVQLLYACFFHTTSHSYTPSDNISHLKLKVLGSRQPKGKCHTGDQWQD